MNKELNYSLDQRTYQHRYFDMTIEDGIVYATYKVAHMNIEIAREVIARRTALMQPDTYPLLLDLSNLIQVDEEAMLYSAGEDGIKLISCAAFMMKSEINGLGYETFSQFEPLVPIKAFHVSQKEEAIQWLKYMSNIN